MWARSEIRWKEAEQLSRGRLALVAIGMVGDREGCLAAGMHDDSSEPFSGERAALRALALAAGDGERGGGMGPSVGQPQPERAAGAAPAIDASVLEALRELQAPGAPDLRRRIICLYLEQTPAQVRALRAGLEPKDPAVMLRSAHAMKSSSANVGAGALAALCRDLETRLRQSNSDDAAPRVEAIEAEYARVRRELDAYLEGLRG